MGLNINMEKEIEFTILDIDKLSAPISDDNRVGENLRYEGTYDKIREFRESDDPNLPQGVWETDLKAANWKGIKEICTLTLADRSKDLQITAWLLEALVHLDGFAGVYEGLSLIYKLCVDYWDDIYPVIEDDDIEFRISPFVWINSTISEKLRIIPITQPSDPKNDPFNFLDWEKIAHMENLAKQSAAAKKNLESEKKYTKTNYKKSADSTPSSFFASTETYLQSTLSIVGELSGYLDKACGDKSPALGRFRKTLEDIRLRISKHNTKAVSTAVSGDDEAEDSSENDRPFSNKPMSPSLSIEAGFQIKNREEAYHALSEIAEFLMEIDPHSPVPFLIKRAVNWGSMSLSELLTELLKDGANIQQVYSLLGIQE